MAEVSCKRSVLATLIAVVVLRMLGLFLVVPVLMQHQDAWSGATPGTLGVALGIYGLTQACCQMPLGWLSDRWGRKPVLLMALGIYVLGSLVALWANHIMLFVLGRMLQGAGALGATAMAWVADVTPTAKHPQVMAIMGMSIGASFVVALIGSSVVDAAFGLSGILWVGVGAGLLALLLALRLPPPAEQTRSEPALGFRSAFQQVMAIPALRYYQMTVLLLHALLACLLVAAPLRLQAVMGLEVVLWHWYVPTLLLAVLILWPVLRLSSNTAYIQHIARGCMVFLGLGLLSICLMNQGFFLAAGLLVFWWAFNWLEASLPSWYARTVPPALKGAGLGIFATAQFLGMFLGSSLAGYLWQGYHEQGVAIGAAFLVCLWLIMAHFSHSHDKQRKGACSWRAESTKSF